MKGLTVRNKSQCNPTNDLQGSNDAPVPFGRYFDIEQASEWNDFSVLDVLLPLKREKRY